MGLGPCGRPHPDWGLHGCGKARERLGSLCAMEVEALKRRPPTEVGGLGLEFSLGFRDQGLGFRV